MLTNYLKIALRNLLRQKGYSLLNVAGLAVGLACAFLITVWIQDEVRYDRFHESGDRLYRVMRHVYSGDEIRTSNSVTFNIAHALEEAYPEVEDVTVVTQPVTLVMKRGELAIYEWGLYAGPQFFDMFSWNLVQGDPAEVLRDPTSIVISTSLAQKYFGSDWRQHAVGGTISDPVYDLGDFTVTGVFEDVPNNSSLQFDFVLPIEVFVRQNEWLHSWMNSGIRIFVRTHEDADGSALSEKITDIQNEYIEGFRSDIFLQPYVDQRLYSNFRDGMLAGGMIDYLRIFGVVAIMIVLIASINFMNLATARSMRRAREIGVRKAIGAGRRSLASQFLGESALLVFVAFILAVGLVFAVLPAFNGLTEKDIAIADLGVSTLLVFAGIGVLTALLAGSYPALYLSSFDPVGILRGTFRLSGGSVRLRRVLVVFQFAMSILLIVGTITVYRQIQYIHSKNLGLDRENVISLFMHGDMPEQFDTVKEELLRRPGIAHVTSTSTNPLNVGGNTHSVLWRGKDPDAQISMSIITANFDFLDVMKIELAAGRDFDPAFGTDSVNYIINERALEVMGFERPLGERLSFWGDSGTIVGVAKDFHMTSLYNEIEPTIIRLRPEQALNLYVRTEPGQISQALASLEGIYTTFAPGHPFEPQFLDDDFREMYRSETVIGSLAGIFTGIALFIACLGLFGLASFTAQQRTKEIGVRKVLGATVGGLASLLSRDFIALVMIAFVLAAPPAYILARGWLGNFEYRTEMGPGIFVLTGTLVIVIAVATVGYQSVRAALADPVKCLRYE